METLKAKIIICDIEGTTTSISFVKDVLFPFSKQHVNNFLSENRDDPEVQSIFSELQKLPEYKGEYNEVLNDNSITEITNFVKTLVDNDKKLGPLKCLQGLIWKRGYDNGSIQGHVYSDVLKAFKKWTDQKIKIYIYSSGSVQAQKLLFLNSVDGNLLPYITGHFDTNIGYKQHPSSYESILKQMQTSAQGVIFFTDIIEEAIAATTAGIQAILLERPGNKPFVEIECKKFVIIKSFDDIEIKKFD